MKRWIVAIAALMLGAAVQADDFSGRITETAVGNPEPTVTIDGNVYAVSPQTSVSVEGAGGSTYYLSQRDLAAGQWVRYRLSNEAGQVGELESIEVTGPSAELQRLVKSMP